MQGRGRVETETYGHLRNELRAVWPTERPGAFRSRSSPRRLRDVSGAAAMPADEGDDGSGDRGGQLNYWRLACGVRPLPLRLAGAQERALSRPSRSPLPLSAAYRCLRSTAGSCRRSHFYNQTTIRDRTIDQSIAKDFNNINSSLITTLPGRSTLPTALETFIDRFLLAHLCR